MTDETEAVAIAAPEWAWKLAEAIVLGSQGPGNAAVMIERAFKAKLARARQEGWNAAIEAVCAEFECDELDVVSIVRALASDAKGEG